MRRYLRAAALLLLLLLLTVPAAAQFGRWQPGTGEPIVLVGTDPAAGAEISQTVPAGFVWRLTSIKFALTTDATVANRLPILTLDDGTNIYLSYPAAAVQAASLGVNYTGVPFSITGAVSGFQFISLPPTGILLLPGWRVRTVTTAFQAGDNYSAPTLYFEQYRR